MRQFFWIWTVCILLSSCNMAENNKKPFTLDGAWTVSLVEYPVGRTDTFPTNGQTILRFYEGDSVMTQFRLTRTENAIVIQREGSCGVTLIDKGGGERLYLEEEDPCPLTVKDNTTIVIQQNGILHTWHRADDITDEWGDEIHDLANNDLGKAHMDGPHHYVLSSREKEQASFIHWLYFTIALLILVFLQITLSNRKARRHLQLQLRQIQEEHENRPQPVRKAIKTMESEFFASEDYLALQRRISNGQRLKDEEWDAVEEQVKSVYPGFSSQLRNLCMMSDLEYQICMLVKLRMAPTSIASVLSRDVSTISTVRSRLYKKVFGKKGGAKEWDDFIHSIGA